MVSLMGSGNGDGTRVLVVEGDDGQRLALARWLASMPGVEVTAVSTAREALAAEPAATYGVCLLRRELDGVDGITLGAMIRTVNADARLVLMCGGSCPRTARLAFEHGFAAVVEGPVAREQLAGLLAGVVMVGAIA